MYHYSLDFNIMMCIGKVWHSPYVFSCAILCT